MGPSLVGPADSGLIFHGPGPAQDRPGLKTIFYEAKFDHKNGLHLA